MQEGQRPVAVGLFFSLGHSTIVVLLSLLVAQGTSYVKNHFPEFQAVGGILGTSISAFFLLLIALVNLVIFLEVFKRFQAARNGETCDADALQDMLGGLGLDRPRAAGAVPLDRRELAHVFRGPAVRLGVRYGHRDCLAGNRRHPGRPPGADLVDHGVSASVHLGHVPVGHDRRRGHAGRLRLGLRQAHAKALLQHDDYAGVLRDRAVDRQPGSAQRAGRRGCISTRASGRTSAPWARTAR